MDEDIRATLGEINSSLRGIDDSLRVVALAAMAKVVPPAGFYDSWKEAWEDACLALVGDIIGHSRAQGMLSAAAVALREARKPA